MKREHLWIEMYVGDYNVDKLGMVRKDVFYHVGIVLKVKKRIDNLNKYKEELHRTLDRLIRKINIKLSYVVENESRDSNKLNNN